MAHWTAYLRESEDARSAAGTMNRRFLPRVAHEIARDMLICGEPDVPSPAAILAELTDMTEAASDAADLAAVKWAVADALRHQPKPKPVAPTVQPVAAEPFGKMAATLIRAAFPVRDMGDKSRDWGDIVWALMMRERKASQPSARREAKRWDVFGFTGPSLRKSWNDACEAGWSIC